MNGSGLMYKCDENASTLPEIVECHVSYFNSSLNVPVVEGRKELLGMNICYVGTCSSYLHTHHEHGWHLRTPDALSPCF